MPRIVRLPYGLTAPQQACLLAAMRSGLIVPREGGRYQAWSAMSVVPSFQANLVATLVKRGLLERAERMAKGAAPTRAGYLLGWQIARERDEAARTRLLRHVKASETPPAHRAAA